MVILFIQRLRITDLDIRVFSTTEQEREITRRQCPLIEQQPHGAIPRHHQPLLAGQKAIRHLYPLREAYLPQALQPPLHLRNGTGHQQAPRIVAKPLHRPRHTTDRLFPAGIVVIHLLPSPRITGGVQLLARTGHIITIHLPLIIGRISLIDQASPGGIRIQDRIPGLVALQDKARLPQTDLRRRSLFRVIPDHGSHHILSLTQERGQVDRLKIPVIDIPPDRTQRDQLPIHIKLITIVGRDMRHHRIRQRRQLKRFPEVINTIRTPVVARATDPTRRPTLHEQLRIDPFRPVTLQANLRVKARAEESEQQTGQE